MKSSTWSFLCLTGIVGFFTVNAHVSKEVFVVSETAVEKPTWTSTETNSARTTEGINRFSPPQIPPSSDPTTPFTQTVGWIAKKKRTKNLKDFSGHASNYRTYQL